MFEPHFRKRDLVPFFGSGFTKGCPACGGCVPSVDELKNRLVQTIAEIEGYTENERLELANEKLTQVSEYFWQAMNHAPDESFRADFFSYIENHFSGVHDLPEEKRQLADCSWRYLYTLNYDDALEQASENLLCVAPFAPQNKHWLSQKRCLYKIHGDVAQYLKTGDDRMCILSLTQYLIALKDPDNADMREKLEADFSSNNLIFFGCSLIDELDLLFTSEMGLSKKKMQNKDTRSYYVRYIGKDTPTLTKMMLGKFEQFSITDIIEVSAADMAEFYSFVRSVSDAAATLKESDSLSPFMGFSFATLAPHDREANIKYLFYSGEIQPKADTKQIILPSFFIRRCTGANIIADIDMNRGSLHILRGSRINGKTYILIDILRQFQSRSIYYFRSGTEISDGLLQKLIDMQDTILLFDEHTVSYEQINLLTQSGLNSLEKNHSHAVVAVNLSSGIFTRHYYDAFPQLKGRVMIYCLSRELKSDDRYKEFDDFSREVGKLGVPPPKSDSTFLDIMIQMDDASIHQNRACLPEVHIFNGTDQADKLKALILFANQESISIPQANIMGVDAALYSLCSTQGVDMAVQKDYLTEAELTPETHHRMRFVVNSKYWAYRCLSEYASNKKNYGAIAKTYYSIVKTIQRKYGFDTAKVVRKNYFQEVKPYYFLDTIQFTFFGITEMGGSLSLPQKIYDELLPLFRNDYQYLHQKAKCQLWSSKLEKNMQKRQKLLDAAFQQINRAYELAEQRQSKNIRFTLYHMQVTKTLVLVNHWRYCDSLLTPEGKNAQLSIVLRALYQMELEMNTCLTDDPDDKMDKQEMRDIMWFITDLGGGETNQFLLPVNRALAGEVITLAKKLKLNSGRV
ncbi:MAG: SIR2 family protein [Intestinimonas sp.]|nr:SIR2 family protein [Intestinimonas sp.]